MIKWTVVIEGYSEDECSLPPGAEIELVDGVPCIGRCEACGEVILEGQAYYHDDDGVMWHTACEDDWRSPGQDQKG